MGIMTKIFGSYSDHQVKKLEKIAAKIEALATHIRICPTMSFVG